MSDNAETAVLAGGCFWIMQQLLRDRDGVISTRVGWTGGENDNPTEDNNCGHAEAVEVAFDPDRISYRDLLEFFYTNEEQRKVAEQTICDVDASGHWPGKIVTKISAAGPFWEAEAEDQDYFRRYTDGNNQFSPSRFAAR